MNGNKPGQSISEVWLYGLAVLIAASLRFIGLGTNPLNNVEAGWALQAFDLARGGHPLLGPQPGYLLLTAAGFFATEASAFMARFWPALAGTSLALAPLLFRERLGRRAALVLAFGFALEPSLVAASHQADGRMIAISGMVYALGFILNRNTPLAGIAAGFALLGGPTIWHGLIAGGLGLIAGHLIAPREPGGSPASPLDWRGFLIWMVGTLLFLATLFGFFPGGLSALGSSPIQYLQGWFGGSTTPISLMLTAWVLLSPLTLFAGFSGLIRSLVRREPLDETIIWTGVFLTLLTLAYPARQTADLAWQAVPMLALAARQISRLSWQSDHPKTVLGYTILVAVLCFSISLNYQGLLGNPPQDQQTLRWGGVLGTLFLLGASFLLIAWGWAWRVAIQGVVFGVSGVLVVYLLATSWSAAGLGARPEAELWPPGIYPKESALALKVIGEASEWSTGRGDTLDLTVSGIDSASLRWALRNYRNVNYVSQLPLEGQLSLVLTPESQGSSLNLPAAYTGQRLEWGEQINWSQLLAGDWFRWLFYRDLGNQSLLVNRQNVILWVRSDLFPGASKANVQP